MKLFALASLAFAFLAKTVNAVPVTNDMTITDDLPTTHEFSHHDISVNRALKTKHELEKRDATYDCNSVHLGDANCGVIWAGIYYLEEDKGQQLFCDAHSLCRWSCSWNVGLWYENTSPNKQYIKRGEFANEIRDIISHCRNGKSCVDDGSAQEYWIRAEKNYGRDDHRIIISHTTPFNQHC